MQYEILAFAQLRERFGASKVSVDLPEESTLKDLQALLIKRFPEAEVTILASRFAVNQTYAVHLEQPLVHGDELALIPPVSGG